MSIDATKDYYAILGVLPTAEDVVIRAAYKALAQRYHPDRNPNAREEATRRMAEINEAFGVLSDPKQRQQYDSLRNSGRQSADAYFDESDDSEAFADPMEQDWRVAVEYLPDLEDLRKRLAKISRRLEFTFRAVMLESKVFDKRVLVAETMEREFLKLYFGDDTEILDFARRLINLGNKAAAKALNNAVRILGQSIPAQQVIAKISKDFLPPDMQKAKTFSNREALEFLNTIRTGKLLDIEAALTENPSIVQAKTSEGLTALHIAVEEGSLSRVELLVRFGADHRARTNHGEMPLDIANRIGRGRTEIAEFLRKLR